jgi:hypothetical protein
MNILKKLFEWPVASNRTGKENADLQQSRTVPIRNHPRPEGDPIVAEKYEPIIFFLHVPKTAGSTVNFVLKNYFSCGYAHCESFIHDNDQLRSALRACEWISGHVDFITADHTLRHCTRREIRYFSCIRSPTTHVMSHYNWLIEIFYRGKDFYNNHPAAIKEISEIVRSSPKDAASIAANLMRFDKLLLNAQSHYILGRTFDWDKDDPHARLDRYEMLVDSSDVQILLAHLVGHALTDDHRENVSTYHFDPAVFETDEMMAFLNERNARDEMLYKSIVAGQRETA